MEIDVHIDDREVMAALQRLLSVSSDMSPAMRDITGVLASATERAFAQQADPATGTPWAELSDVTKARRATDGHWPGSILQVTGALARDMESDYGADYAIYGTNKIYAGTQHAGASKGEFGSTRKGSPIPWSDIPARPFVGINGDDEEEILDILSRHLEEALNSR